MAVTVTSNPLIIPAADAGATVIVSRNIWITAIVWDQGASVSGDAAVIQDRHGVVKWSHTVTTSLATAPGITFSKPVPSDGIIVPTLARGTLYIYYNENSNK